MYSCIFVTSWKKLYYMCSKVKILDSEVILLRVYSCLHCLENHVYISWNIKSRVCQWFKCRLSIMNRNSWNEKVVFGAWALSDMMKGYVNLPLKLTMHLVYITLFDGVLCESSFMSTCWQLGIPCQSNAPFGRCGWESLSFSRQVLVCFDS